MIPVGAEWNRQHAGLKELLTKKETAREAISLCLDMHLMLHDSPVSGTGKTTYSDPLWVNFTEDKFRFTTEKDRSMAWHIWHISRIEDLVSSLLIGDEKPVLNRNRLRKIGITAKDTGNAMTREEISIFSERVNLQELREYRRDVGRLTRRILEEMTPEDLKRKPAAKQLDRIKEEGGVTEHPDSSWLIDFWGRKTVAGLILMPLTRHLVVHLNHAYKIGEKRT